MKPNITMIGIPSSDKSTIGILSVKRLGFSFANVDIVMQEKEGRLLRGIIVQEGTDGSLKVEERISAELDVTLSVVVSGGSAIYGGKAMEYLKEINEVVYLKASCGEMENRTGNVVDRSVAPKPGFTPRDLYNERMPYYEKYTGITIGEEGKIPKGTVDALRDITEEMMDRSMIERTMGEQKKTLEEKDRKIGAYKAKVAALREELAPFRAAEAGGYGNQRLRKLRQWKLPAAEIRAVETTGEEAIQRLGHGWKKVRFDL